MGKRNRAAVVVLGDIGRSPRMQYHALSLALQAFLDVDIVAYGGSEPHISLLQNQSIHIHEMPQWPAFPRRLSKLLQPLFLILKPIFQLLVLLWYLCVKIPAPDVFIVQNPPSVPTLVVVKFSSWFRHSAIIVDWHNFGYTLLALSLGRNSIFVAMYRWIEKRFGKMAHGSLCVTRAMQHELSQNWGIKATVLYDQPPEFFQPASVGEMHNLFCRISNSINKPDGLRDCVGNGLTTAPNNDPNTTPFTTQVGSDILLKQNRPVLLVSSTSWTPDEDFGILLGAALMYDRRVAALLGEDDSIGDEVVWDEYHNGKQFQYPRLLFIITGKGPEKEKFEEKIRKLKLKRVAFRTMWLSAEDYPLLLGSADLGVCLHTSSSGLDLPMKVVDMFGCGLPVCAVSYSCIKELVDVEKNGLLFSSSTELADELMMLFEGFPEKCDALKSMRSNLMGRVSSVRWSTAWEENAKPLIYEDTITELEDKLLEESFLSKDDHPQCKLADIIVEKLKQKDAQVSSGVQPTQKLDDSIIELYKGVGKLLNKYTSGKIPKAFKHVPSLQFWEEVLHLTEPEKWSPNAMYQATKIFASNMGVKKVERFYKFVLLPRVREDIRKNKRLHFALYQSLKKALYKPAAFNKGILFQLCESRTCTLREAVIIGSIIEKISIPPLHSSVTLLKLAEMEYCGTTSYFIKLQIEKKYALPYRVLDALVAHFMKFYDDSREMPVIWHQSLLAFAQRYKNELTKEDKANLNTLVGRQRHKLVSPEILRELNNSRNRGEKADDPMSITTPLSIVNKTIQEDRFDIPEVPMEED